MEIQLLPKYINWVNENLSYGAELGYERFTDAKDAPEKQMYHIRPGSIWDSAVISCISMPSWAG